MKAPSIPRLVARNGTRIAAFRTTVVTLSRCVSASPSDPSRPSREAPTEISVVRGRRLRPMPDYREVFDPRTQSRFAWDAPPVDLLADASPRTVRMRLLRRIVATLIGVALVGAGIAAYLAVRRSPLTTENEPSIGGASARFASIRTDDLRQAWPTLAALPHTRVAHTTQLDEDDLIRAVQEREFHNRRLVRDSTAGTFDYGLYRTFPSGVASSPDPEDVGALALASLPSVLRDSSVYRFTRRADSVMAERPVEVVEAVARRGAGDGENVRRVTLYFDPQSPRVVGMDVYRVDLDLLFREEAWMRVETAPTPDGRLRPWRTEFLSRVVMPFVPTQPIATTAIYRLD